MSLVRVVEAVSAPPAIGGSTKAPIRVAGGGGQALADPEPDCRDHPREPHHRRLLSQNGASPNWRSIAFTRSAGELMAPRSSGSDERAPALVTGRPPVLPAPRRASATRPASRSAPSASVTKCFAYFGWPRRYWSASSRSAPSGPYFWPSSRTIDSTSRRGSPRLYSGWFE